MTGSAGEAACESRWNPATDCVRPEPGQWRGGEYHHHHPRHRPVTGRLPHTGHIHTISYIQLHY